ncbi:secondary thiamine-phosphate synthase enzyme YjbQ [Vallitalea maricola]|uniref:Secondary thiamine-phosphate synthase enzyme YjbQ n=1 Tax=Vallitalea maricola TaxID=3074433 RepID=A0ACB5UER5_9FIRM|nr:secondary thiamine-phosphate synthase enzyme YjbQ [Vallitalea sp. AN17-2]
MITKMIQVKTNKHVEMIDITSKVQNIIESEGIEDGICTVFIPHTTAGITINENADPDVTRDMLMELNKIVPLEDGYRHMEGNSAAHIKSSMMGFSETIIIKERKLLLGTWQGIYFCEFDGPRNRKTMINIMIEK